MAKNKFCEVTVTFDLLTTKINHQDIFGQQCEFSCQSSPNLNFMRHSFRLINLLNILRHCLFCDRPEEGASPCFSDEKSKTFTIKLPLSYPATMM